MEKDQPTKNNEQLNNIYKKSVKDLQIVYRKGGKISKSGYLTQILIPQVQVILSLMVVMIVEGIILIANI